MIYFKEFNEVWRKIRRKMGVWDFCPRLLAIGILGDINGDGKVTVEDALMILQMHVKLIPWTTRALLLGDGIIDTTDAALTLRMVVGG